MRTSIILIFTQIIISSSMLSASDQDECFDLNSSVEKWIEALIEEDWAEDWISYLKEEDEDEIWYFIQTTEAFFETEEEVMEYAQFQSMSLESDFVEWLDEKISALDKELAVDFVRTDERSDSDFIIAVHDGTNPDNYVNLTMTGYVSETADGEEYVLVMNWNLDDDSFLTTFYHELGHVLGLEHPFASDDDDCIGSTEEYGDETAHKGLTLMAYQDPPDDWPYPDFYTENDLLALKRIFEFLE
ncbi:hypothetical protein N9E48_09910 [Paracoccaceae bacterium]|nr:hypothetical protein [Paracoccaceae bacterium]